MAYYTGSKYACYVPPTSKWTPYFTAPSLGRYLRYGKFLKSGTRNMDPQNIRILIMGTPKKVPLILGNAHMEDARMFGRTV